MLRFHSTAITLTSLELGTAPLNERIPLKTRFQPPLYHIVAYSVLNTCTKFQTFSSRCSATTSLSRITAIIDTNMLQFI
ncbi:hypothetical protein ABKN59_011790 [Abortiporus biennis]